MRRNDLYVFSTGTHARDGMGAAQQAIAVCKEQGVDISGHRTSPVNGDIVRKADAIYAMEPVHIDFMKLFYPEIADKAWLLAHWSADKKVRKEGCIPDPVGGSLADFKDVFYLISQCIDTLLPDLEEWTSSQ